MQHGAAMCNMLFAQEGSCVLEIVNDEDIDYYEKMISKTGMHRSIIVQEHRHAPIDPNFLTSCLADLMRSSMTML